VLKGRNLWAATLLGAVHLAGSAAVIAGLVDALAFAVLAVSILR
jgi:hypothetical protein